MLFAAMYQTVDPANQVVLNTTLANPALRDTFVACVEALEQRLAVINVTNDAKDIASEYIIIRLEMKVYQEMIAFLDTLLAKPPTN